MNAALALDISPATFDSWVELGLIPSGKKIGGLRMWSARELESVAEELVLHSRNDNQARFDTDAFKDFKG